RHDQLHLRGVALGAVLRGGLPPAAALRRRLVGEDVVEVGARAAPRVQPTDVRPLVVAALEVLVGRGAVVVEVVLLPVLLLDAEVDLGALPHVFYTHAPLTLPPIEDAPHPYDRRALCCSLLVVLAGAHRELQEIVPSLPDRRQPIPQLAERREPGPRVV